MFKVKQYLMQEEARLALKQVGEISLYIEHSCLAVDDWNTLRVKKQDTLLMSITSRNINRFSKYFHY